MSQLKPKIYVACLAAYNNGFLHGDWIDANQGVDDLYVAVNTILVSSPIPDAEEFAIHDYDEFGGVCINEYTALDTVAALAEFIVEHDELGAAVLGHVNEDIDEARKLLEECYHGEYDSEEDFAASLTEETMTIPEYFAYYIDYEKMARDWFINDYFSIEINHKTHVFSNY
jgi:antirestriction protein